MLALLPPGAALPGDALASFLGVPTPYLAKQLQALSRAGIVAAKPGAAGGYRLSRLPETISLWDITAAIEGSLPSFRCSDVRRSGPCGASANECARPCVIAQSFRDAEQLCRQALAAVELPEVVNGVARDASATRKQRISEWVAMHATQAS